MCVFACVGEKQLKEKERPSPLLRNSLSQIYTEKHDSGELTKNICFVCVCVCVWAKSNWKKKNDLQLYWETVIAILYRKTCFEWTNEKISVSCVCVCGRKAVETKGTTITSVEKQFIAIFYRKTCFGWANKKTFVSCACVCSRKAVETKITKITCFLETVYRHFTQKKTCYGWTNKKKFSHDYF